jgi:hypothetical protein
LLLLLPITHQPITINGEKDQGLPRHRTNPDPGENARCKKGLTKVSKKELAYRRFAAVAGLALHDRRKEVDQHVRSN